MTPSPPCRIAVGPTTDTALAALHTRRKRKSTIRTMRNIAVYVTWAFFNLLLLLAPFDKRTFYCCGEPLNLLAVQPSGNHSGRPFDLVRALVKPEREKH